MIYLYNIIPYFKIKCRKLYPLVVIFFSWKCSAIFSDILNNAKKWNNFGKNEVYLPIRAKAWVQVVIETTKLGTEEQERLTLLPSAKRTSLFPFGQIIWSTCVRTFSQVKSWVLSDITSISVLEWPMLHTEKLLDKHSYQTFIQRKKKSSK